MQRLRPRPGCHVWGRITSLWTLSGEMRQSCLDISLKRLVCTVSVSQREPRSCEVSPSCRQTERLIPAAPLNEDIDCVWCVGRRLSGCLSQTDGEGESLIETEPGRSAIYSPDRPSFSGVHSSCLSTRRQEAKASLSFPDWLNLSSLGFDKSCLCLNRLPIFNSSIILRFHVLLLFCFSSKGK